MILSFISGRVMKKIAILIACFFCMLYVFASEDRLEERYPQKKLDLSAKQKEILQESKILEKKNLEVKQKSDVKKQENIKGSTILRDLNKERIIRGWFDSKHAEQEKKQKELFFAKTWIYGTAVITTTFLDGSIKRSYGVLLRDGMFVTSANMVYDKNVYARVSYAMMQDDSSIPFICVAKLSIKALDLQKGLAILETLEFTDIYCNSREKSYYHDRIYSGYWVDIFDNKSDGQEAIVYSPYITQLNSFAVEKNILQGNLKQLAEKESNDFEGYKYAFGKGFYTHDGKLLGIIGADNGGNPKLIKTKEIAEFLCELKDRKILKNPYLQSSCVSSKKDETHN